MDDNGTVSLAKVPMSETWKCLEEAVEAGIVKSIGVSNCSTQLLYDMLCYAKQPISSLQIEHHPYLVQPELIKMAQENDIAVTGMPSDLCSSLNRFVNSGRK